LMAGEALLERLDPRVSEAVARHFEVVKAYWERVTPTFIVRPRGEGYRQSLVKPSFKSLAAELKPLGYLPKIRWIVDSYHISILPRGEPVEEDQSRFRLLLAVTVLTIALDGFLRSRNPVLARELMADTPLVFNVAVFTLGVLLIFAVHEFGHRLVALRKGLDVSMPYFIPAPPGMGGTLGAVIAQREPPVNRDDLFDLGLSGPLAGFAVTTVLSFIGLWLSFVVDEAWVFRWMVEYPATRFQIIPLPQVMEAAASLVKPTGPGEVLILHPLAFACWVGFMVTFINLIPSWQLDGGHIVRSLLGRESHKIVSVAGVLLLVVSGYVVMGVVVAFFMMREGRESVEPLDDLSPLSLSRKLGLLVYVGVMILSLVTLFSV